MTKVYVYLIEPNQNSAHKIDEIKEFDTKKEAQQFIEKHDLCNKNDVSKQYKYVKLL